MSSQSNDAQASASDNASPARVGPPTPDENAENAAIGTNPSAEGSDSDRAEVLPGTDLAASTDDPIHNADTEESDGREDHSTTADAMGRLSEPREQVDDSEQLSGSADSAVHAETMEDGAEHSGTSVLRSPVAPEAPFLEEDEDVSSRRSSSATERVPTLAENKPAEYSTETSNSDAKPREQQELPILPPLPGHRSVTFSPLLERAASDIPHLNTTNIQSFGTPTGTSFEPNASIANVSSSPIPQRWAASAETGFSGGEDQGVIRDESLHDAGPRDDNGNIINNEINEDEAVMDPDNVGLLEKSLYIGAKTDVCFLSAVDATHSSCTSQTTFGAAGEVAV